MFADQRRQGIGTRSVWFNGHRFIDHRIAVGPNAGRHFVAVFVQDSDRYPRVTGTSRRRGR